MQTLTSEVYLEGLVFGECPRWRDGALWLSDMFGGRVLRSTGAGKAETVLDLKGGRPSGLAFLDDGSLLVVPLYMQHDVVFYTLGAPWRASPDSAASSSSSWRSTVVRGPNIWPDAMRKRSA